jgi:serine/threonine-protein kinase
MSREDQLADLLERWEDAIAKGLTITPAEVCRDCPEFLDEFQKLLAKLGPVNAVLQGGGKAATSPQDLIGRIDAGRYRPVSYIDEGGQGLVFLAEDTELHRSVALKWMRPLTALDPDLRRRFLQEAEITAKLDHPGVVPVYGQGQDPEGRPYYAMRFIRGENLGEIARRFHTARDDDRAARNVEFRRLLQSFVAVCETIAYAHARGVVHRDLKPGNIRLGPFGETLVLDWGLAKRLDHTAQDDFDPERTSLQPVALSDTSVGSTVRGRAAGSPAYMAPEQARGDIDQVDMATDIYGLGATLYMLLTGRPPFQGKSATEVIELVKNGTFPLPRELQPQLSSALQAICLKAMAYRPADRYSSAQALAADVERWLADEPISAWREPIALRARRWVKRNRTLVTTAVAVLLVSVVSLGVLGVAQHQNNNKLEQKNEDLRQAIQKQSAAENTVRLRNQELDKANGDLRTEVAKRTAAETNASDDRQYFVLTIGEMVNVVAESLKASELAFTNKKQDSEPGERPVKPDQGERLAKLVDYREQLLNLAKDKLAAKNISSNSPIAWQIDHIRVRVQMNLAGTSKTMANPEATLEVYGQALDLAKQVAEREPNDLEAQRDVSVCYNAMGTVRLRMKPPDLDQALALFLSDKEISERLARESKNDLAQRDLAITYRSLGETYLAKCLNDKALEHYDKALTLMQRAADGNPANAKLQREFWQMIGDFANVRTKLGQSDEEVRLRKQALTVCRRRVDAEPNNLQTLQELSLSYFRLGSLHFRREEYSQAEKMLLEDMHISQRLADEFKDLEAHTGLAVTCAKLGETYLRLGQTEQALKICHQEQEMLKRVAIPSAKEADRLRDLSAYWNRLGRTYVRLHKIDEALAMYQHDLEISQHLVDSSPQKSAISDLLFTFKDLAHLHQKMNDTGKAKAWFQRALDLCERFARRSEADKKDFDNDIKSLRRDIDLCDAVTAVVSDPTAVNNQLAKQRRTIFYKAVEILAIYWETDKLVQIAEVFASAGKGEGEYDAGCALARAAAVTFDSKIKEQFSRKAVQYLRDAIDHGFNDLALMKRDTDLEAVRDRQDFKQLLADLEAKLNKK